jgi:hypothetical protein
VAVSDFNNDGTLDVVATDLSLRFTKARPSRNRLSLCLVIRRGICAGPYPKARVTKIGPKRHRQVTSSHFRSPILTPLYAMHS